MQSKREVEPLLLLVSMLRRYGIIRSFLIRLPGVVLNYREGRFDFVA